MSGKMNTLKNYDESIHTVGRIWMLSGLCLMLMVPVVISIVFNVWPKFTNIMKGLGPLVIIFYPIGVIEVLTYAPMLGAGGTYLGFVTGNLANLKVPCALNAMQVNNITPGTKEGEIISTIAVAASSLVTNLVLAAGVILLIPLTPILQNPAISPAFDNILPALFGALGVVFISRNWKLSVVPVLLMVIIFIVYPAAPVGVLIPVGALAAIGAGRILYKKNLV